MDSLTIDNEQFILYKKLDDSDINLKNTDVKVTVHAKDPSIKITLKGKSIDHSVSNAIRLAILMYIPVFNFHRSKLQVEKKESGYSNSYNNDRIETIVENCPIYNIEFDEYLLNPDIHLPPDVNKTIFSNFTQEKYENITDLDNNRTKNTPPGPQSEKMGTKGTEGTQDRESEIKIPKIIMALTKINTDPLKTIFATTHDCKLTVNGKNSDEYKKHDRIDLFLLHPGESISFIVEAVLGISLMYGIHNSTTVVVSKEISENHYELLYDTLGQIASIDIFRKACSILIRKLELLNEFIASNYRNQVETNQYVEIQIKGENHMLGNTLSTTLKKSRDIREASYVMPHSLDNLIIIKYKLNDDSKIKDPIDAILHVIEYLIKIYGSILDQI